MSRGGRCVLWVGLILGGCAAVGCGDQRGGGGTGAGPRPDDNAPPFGAVRGADQLVLYEGLPRLTPEQLGEEQRKRETLTLRDFPFYRAPPAVSDEDREKLRGLLGAEGTFEPWRGEKKCGGFHPDFLAEWRAGGAAYQFLICFGCEEAKVYGPDLGLRYDIRQEAFARLVELLRKYGTYHHPTGRGP